MDEEAQWLLSNKKILKINKKVKIEQSFGNIFFFFQ